VQAFIRTMRELHDSTILLCTHDMAEAEALADRIGILHRGELLCLESAEEIAGATAPARSSSVPERDRALVRGRAGRGSGGRRGRGGDGVIRLQEDRCAAS